MDYVLQNYPRKKVISNKLGDGGIESICALTTEWRWWCCCRTQHGNAGPWKHSVGEGCTSPCQHIAHLSAHSASQSDWDPGQKIHSSAIVEGFCWSSWNLAGVLNIPVLYSAGVSPTFSSALLFFLWDSFLTRDSFCETFCLASCMIFH